MKKIIIILVCFSAFAIAFASEQIIGSLQAKVSSDAVNIEWRTNSEANISRFEIERSTTNGFKLIENRKANGKASYYKFTDSDTFKKETQSEFQAGNVALYRLKVIYSNPVNGSNFFYSNEVTAIQNMSNIKRTLGMIKEMFK